MRSPPGSGCPSAAICKPAELLATDPDALWEGLPRRKVQTLRCAGAVCGSVIPPIVRRQVTLSAATIHPRVIPVCV